MRNLLHRWHRQALRDTVGLAWADTSTILLFKLGSRIGRIRVGGGLLLRFTAGHGRHCPLTNRPLIATPFPLLTAVDAQSDVDTVVG